MKKSNERECDSCGCFKAAKKLVRIGLAEWYFCDYHAKEKIKKAEKKEAV
jgi:hypothetical protein